MVQAVKKKQSISTKHRQRSSHHSASIKHRRFRLITSERDIEINQRQLSQKPALDPEFQYQVEVFDRYLFSLKKRCDILDTDSLNRVQSEKDSSDQKDIFFTTSIESVTEILNKHFQRIWHILVENLDFIENNLSQDYERHKIYYQRKINPYFLNTAFTKQVLYKPKGYAGDYQMLDAIYNTLESNVGSFQRLIDHYSFHLPISFSVRNRLPYITSKIYELLHQPNCKFLSVACGAAKEVFLLDKLNVVYPLQYHLLDADKSGLDENKSKAKNLINANINLTYFHNNILEIIRDKVDLSSYDLVYSLGLFDYLKDNLFIKLMQKLYDKIKPQGKLIIGNVNVEDNSRAYRAIVLEWYLIQRTPNDLRRLATDAGFTNFTVEQDATGVQLYLVVIKE